MQYTHKMEYYSALKMKEILTRTQMNFEDITLSEICKTQKDKYCMNKPLCVGGGNVNWCGHCGKQHGYYTKVLEQSNSQRQKVESWMPRAEGHGGIGSQCLMGTEICLGKIKFWRYGGDGSTTVRMYLMPLNHNI